VSQIVACELHPLNNLRTLKHIRRTYNLDEDGVNAWYRHWIAEGLGALERLLGAARDVDRPLDALARTTPGHG